jgi:hypothetical protein
LLRIIVTPIAADIEKILDNALMELDCTDESSRAVGFVKVTKQVIALDIF